VFFAHAALFPVPVFVYLFRTSDIIITARKQLHINDYILLATSPQYLHYTTMWNAEVAVWPFTTMNLYQIAHALAEKIPRPQNYWKSVTCLTLIILILRSYVNKVKWCINSDWAALGQRLLNALLASSVNVHYLCSCWKRTFWARASIKMMWCDTYNFLKDNNC